ncbi:hypothetical protein RFI_17201 [Reticulomyxa filosa]|uniref:Cas1p 10 TM acyl transferase domain-containing protein n=1 Tax=Reticulomyxa filosa TaxID=46433 RepID=X6N283_RETFI|nr:hypothetical protein RFI_17201 [Reticulomyxa filosa]|eukprot:ETO20018.1 hypothetical protein RFI_17201 [Reticulomyxa filosa]
MGGISLVEISAINEIKNTVAATPHKLEHRSPHGSNVNVLVADHQKGAKEDHISVSPKPLSNINNNNSSNNNNTASASDKESLKLGRVKPLSKDNPSEVRYLSLPPTLDKPIIRQLIEYYDDNHKVFRAMFGIAVCLMIVYLADGPTHLFPPTLKQYHRDFFMFLHVIFLVISAMTLKRDAAETKSAILSRAQTEEWKGIMQIVFVMVGIYTYTPYMYMFMIWKHSIFLGKKIFNATRFLSMMFRLNFLVFWVCLLLNQPLMLYYICPMHTFFFVMCYLTWGIFYTKNDYKMVVAIKMIVEFVYANCVVFGSISQIHCQILIYIGCLLFLVVMFEIPGMFDIIWSPLTWLLQYHGSLYEWRFRSTLDHYATWCGMLFALFFDRISKALVALEAQTIWYQAKVKGAIIAVTLIIICFWYKYVYVLDKLEYNYIHPYTSFIPIFGYILLRNIVSKASREYVSRFLESMGKITLETYIFQYHVFMIDDAKSVLTVFPGYPLMNFLVVSVVYVLLSKVTFDGTDVLRDWFYPTANNPSNALVLKRTLAYTLTKEKNFSVTLSAKTIIIKTGE